MLDRSGIAARIPHQGNMCLLERLISWSAEQIHCQATRHRDSDNPLRSNGRLGIAGGIEYAAQAMALHGGLLADGSGPPRQGYLTSVRNVVPQVSRLDDLPGTLEVRAERLSGDDNTVLYQFTLEHAGQCLLSGRATVVLDAARFTQGIRS